MKRMISLLLALTMVFGIGAFTAVQAASHGIKIRKSELPRGNFQMTARFPDVTGTQEPMLMANSMVSFLTYHGQGKLYVTVAPGVESFHMFVNNKKVRTGRMKAGDTYLVDVGNVSRDGTNTVAVTNIQPASLKNAVIVRPDFPELIDGSLRDAEISPESTKLIDRLVKADIRHGFSSAQIAIVRNGRLIYQNAWGTVNAYNEDLTRKKGSAKVTNDTLYDIASNTKMFAVNYIVQNLVSEGKLSLDTKIVDVIGPQFAEDTIDMKYDGGDNIPLAENRSLKRGLTIRSLLLHRAGFPADPAYQDSTYPLYSGSDGSAATRQKTLEAICRTPLMFRPDTRTLYSDVDYMLLAFVLEKITGQDLQSYLKKVFWDPMGLTHITYRPLNHGFSKDEIAATEINGNTREGRVTFQGIRKHTIQGEVHDSKCYYCMAGVSGHAGLFSNATDLAKLMMLMLTGGYGNTRYFSQNVIDAFTAPQSETESDWGMGWYRKGNGSHVRFFSTQAPSYAYGHQGWTGAWTMADPKTGLIVVYLTNKRNTPMVDPDKSLTEFDGNIYEAGTLGFVPQLLYMGMDTSDKDMRAVIPDLLDDMIQEKGKMEPGRAVNESMAALREVRKQY